MYRIFRVHADSARFKSPGNRALYAHVPLPRGELLGLSLALDYDDAWRAHIAAGAAASTILRLPVVSLMLNDEDPLFEGVVPLCGFHDNSYMPARNYRSIGAHEIPIRRAVEEGAILRIAQLLPDFEFPIRDGATLRETWPNFKVILRYAD